MRASTGAEREGLLDIVLGVLDRRERAWLAALGTGAARLRRRLAGLLVADHRRLAVHLVPHEEEDRGEGGKHDRRDRERQPAAQAEPRPDRLHERSTRR